MKKAVVLLSGGLDSTTALWWAKSKGYSSAALAVDYGQRHRRELKAARAVARRAGVPLHEVSLPLPWLKVSSLLDAKKELPDLPLSKIGSGGVPSTYVPGRNTIFLSLAMSLAEATGAEALVIGANALDYSGYPDCRPEFLHAFEEVTRTTRRLKILAPLLRLTKRGIVELAGKLRAPIELTWSCYAGKGKPCGKCDSCKLRAKGFAEAGRDDEALRR